MPKEIERKFLIEEMPFTENIIGRQYISQNYLATGDEEVRIRYKKERNTEPDLTLSIKRGSGLEREEITNIITRETYNQLALNCSTKPIIKTRILVQHGKHLLEIDTYENHPLIVGEVEFGSLKEAESFIPPTWFGQEVTEDASYKNQNLWKKWQTD